MGGEGQIFLVHGYPGICAKIYHPGRGDAERRDKLAAMIASPPDDRNRSPSLAWPREVVFHDRDMADCAGFTMPLLDQKEFREAHRLMDPADRAHLFQGSFRFRHCFAAAANLAMVTRAVHARGHAVGDMRDTNVLISSDARVCLIDCDSFQIRDPDTGTVYPTRVGTPEYLAPEFLGPFPPASHEARLLADRFVLAVLIFRLLMDGCHPFQARGLLVSGSHTTAEKVRRGRFPYQEGLYGVSPPAFAPSYTDRLPAPVRHLFERCFITGHRNPPARPSAAEWYRVLAREFPGLVTCTKDPSHWFFPSNGPCPFCSPGEAVPNSSYAEAGGRHIPSQSPQAPPYPRLVMPDSSPNGVHPNYRRVPIVKAKKKTPASPLNGIRPDYRHAPILKSGETDPASSPRGIQPDYRHAPIVKAGETDPASSPRGIQPDYRRAPIVKAGETDPASSPRGIHPDYRRAPIVKAGEKIPTSPPGWVHPPSRSQSPATGPAPKAVPGKSDDLFLQLVLTQILRGPEALRESAVQRLSARGAPAAGPAAALLGNDDPAVRAAARRVLVRIGPPGVPFLVQALRDAKPDRREEMYSALTELDRPAVRALVSRIREEKSQYIGFAGRIIRSVGETAIEPLLSEFTKGDGPTRGFVSWLLSELGEAAVGPLVSLVQQQPVAARWYVAWTIRKIGTPGLSALCDILQNKDREAAAAAAQVLVWIGGPAVPSLVEFLRGNPSACTGMTGTTLVKIGSPSIGPLLGLFESDPGPVRDAAATILGMIGLPAAEPVLGFISHGPGTNRLDAGIAALRGMGPGISGLLAREVLAAGNPQVRAAIADVLFSFEDEGYLQLISATCEKGEPGPGEVQLLSQAGPRVLDHLSVLLLEGSPGIGHTVAAMLYGGPWGEAVVPAILKAAVARGASLPCAAAVVLWHWRGRASCTIAATIPDAPPPLSGSLAGLLALDGRDAAVFLADPASGGVQGEARRRLLAGIVATCISDPHRSPAILAGLPDRERLLVLAALVEGVSPLHPAILSCLADRSHAIRRFVRQTLVQAGETAAGPVAGLLSSADPGIRFEALKTCIIAGPAWVNPVLAAATQQDGDARRLAHLVLERWGKDALPPVIGIVSDENQPASVRSRLMHLINPGEAPETWIIIENAARHDSEELREAAFTVLSRGSGPAAEVLVRLLGSRDPGLRSRAARLLGQLGPVSFPALVPALRGGTPTVRAAAAQVLARLGWQPEGIWDRWLLWSARNTRIAGQ